ncbi:fungal-specific transcription factor domain-containing protein [Aspergillus granulosus]|uniref:Fungal-specific transcription factor domain-containing protein n=1 Tax=Aspergillus granulosus TaxID=176169 RepID=A0ABR4HUR1_9EURO
MFRHSQLPTIPNGDSSQSNTTKGPKDRTRRACERCRQMKIKCDHAATCSNCRSSFNDCVYTESRRKRKASPPVDRLQELEKRVKAMEESYQAISTARDSPQSLKSMAQQQCYPPPISGATASHPQHRPNRHLDEGEARFGCSSGDRAFIDRIKVELGKGPGADFDSRLRLRDRPGTKLLHSASLEPRAISLPPRERAEHLTNIALDSTVLYHVIHRPTFDSAFELLYSLDSSDYGQEERRHIPLVYALMALGCLSERRDHGLSDSPNDVTAERTKYFVTCRDIVDQNDCSDIVTLQTIFYMNLLILSTERLSICYTSLTHALSLAIRVNFQQPSTGDDRVTAEIKRRLFWTLRQLLIAVASMCGYPPPINSNEVDIEEPDDIDDTELKPTRLSTSLQDPSKLRSMSDSIGLLKLHKILERVVRGIYPSGGVQRKRNSGSTDHPVSYQTVIEIERELQTWADTSLLGLNLGQRLPPHLKKAKYELWMTYFHVQIFLYRPFVHYFADKTEANGHTVHGLNKYASACVDASRNLIYLAEDMYRDGLFYGTHWRTAYMICTAGLSLIYVVVSSKTPETVKSLKVDLNRAKKMLECLIPYSPHGRRIHVALTVLIAAFVKSDHGSQYESPNDIAETNMNMGDTVKTYTASPTEQASGNLSQKNRNSIRSEMVRETMAPSPGSLLRSMETGTSQPNPAEMPDIIPASQPIIPQLGTTLIPAGYEDPATQPGAPVAAVPIPVSENTIPQPAEPVTEVIYPAAPSQALELRPSDQTYYLEAQPFNLQRPTEGGDSQLGREFVDFGDLTEDILSFEYLF